MEFRDIGSLKVSTVGIGCNNFGARIDQSQTQLVVDTCLDSGINFFDTADMYGSGKSEEFLGAALRSRRKDVVIATKFGHLFDGEPTGASPKHIRKACEDSLSRLGTDYIDLYQLHTPDLDTPIADTLGALNELVVAGKVREIGCSNFDVTQIRESATVNISGTKRFVSVQNHYSLVHREPEQDVLPACEANGMAFLPFFPLACGLLTGKYRKGAPLPEGTRIKAGSDWINEANIDLAERLIEFAGSRNRTILELAISWLLEKPRVASVIAGATSPEQVRSNVAASTWSLSPEELKIVDSLA
ncbi:MAG: aldo/keto reductase [Chthonomonadaceae bacterium]|nr:aldo/keto reductase [Chthonomonadaceae bacterium]